VKKTGKNYHVKIIVTGSKISTMSWTIIVVMLIIKSFHRRKEPLMNASRLVFLNQDATHLHLEGQIKVVVLRISVFYKVLGVK
jgi:hypothetical protein